MNNKKIEENMQNLFNHKDMKTETLFDTYRKKVSNEWLFMRMYDFL